jgi:hypothetical protein
MTQQTAEITCAVTADTRLLAEVFGSLKQSEINVSKIELFQSLSGEPSYYLHMVMTVEAEHPGQASTLASLRERLKSVSA